MTGKWINLPKICMINPSKNEIYSFPDDTEVSFIPMSSVSEHGDIDTTQIRRLGEVRKGYTYVIDDDVFFAKITPCMENGKGGIAKNLKNGIGFASTEFHILRPVSTVMSKWLYFFLSRKSIRNFAKASMTGSAGQKRVPISFLKKLKIFVPPLSEQIDIVALLEFVDGLRRKRQQAIELLDELLRGTFLDMFGDPIRNPKGWEEIKFSKAGTLDRGKSKHRPRNDPKLLGGPYPLIQTGDVANSGVYITQYNRTYSEEGLKQSRMWPAGTLCITIAANIADTGILTFDSCFPDSIVGFTPNKRVKTEYVKFLLSFLQKILKEIAPESAQKNINLQILRNLYIPLPPIELQNRFAEIVTQAELIRDKMQKSLVEMDNLFHSLMQRAFKGELNLNEETIDSLMERKVPAANSDAELAALDTELMMNMAGCDSIEPKPEFTDIIKFIKHVFSNHPFRFSELMHEAKDQTTDYEKVNDFVFDALREGLNSTDEHLKQCFFDETFDSGDEALNKKLRGTIGFQVCEEKK